MQHHNDSDPLALVVRPRIAQRMLGRIGTNQLWRLLNSNEIESFLDAGGCRRISVASIHDYVARNLAKAKRT